MIEVRNLSYTYPNERSDVFTDVNIKFNSRGLYYIVGESGSGKSTFIHLLSGLVDNYRGEIIVNGLSLKEFSREERSEYLRETCSVSFQFDELFDKQSVFENINKSLDIYHIARREKLNRISNVAKRFKIENLLTKKAELLSGGEAKRVSLARAVAKDFSILLLDEPFGPLDRENRERLTKYFLKVSKRALVIIVSHNRREIPKGAAIYEMIDGNLRAVRNPLHLSEVQQTAKASLSPRKKPGLASKFFSALLMITSRKKQAYFSIFSITIALVTIGLIVLVSSSVSSSLKTYFDGVIDANTILVQPRQEEIKDENYSAASFIQMERLQKKYPKYIEGIGAHYYLNFENLFINKNEVYFNYKNKKYTLSSLSGRSFEEFTYYKELEGNYTNFGETLLTDDQVILGLPYEEIEYLCECLGLTTNDNLDSLNRIFNSSNVYLHLDLTCAKIGYELESLFSIAKIVETDIARIIHTNPLFAESFVEENMRFQGDGKIEEHYKFPWIVHKVYFLYFFPNKKRSALEKISKDSEFSNLSYKSLTGDYMSLDGDIGISNQRVAFYKNYRNTIELSSIEEMVESERENIDSYLISDGFYYCSKEGMVSGFLHPLFASAKREKLNKIEDYNYSADFDLHGFQGSSIVYDDGVVMGDLSNTQDNPLRFLSYLTPPKLVKGYVPNDYSQVIITSSLAKELYGSLNIISSPLYISCLTSTEYLSGGYKNIFRDGKLLVAGIVESTENAILQTPTFIRYLEEDQFLIPMDEKCIDRVVISMKKVANVDCIVAKFKEEYSRYEFSLPARDIESGIDKIILYVNAGLVVFGILSSSISSVLMSEVLILFMKKDERRIKMLICLGWSKRDIASCYLDAALLIGGIAYLNSMLALWLSERFLAQEINLQIGVGIVFYNFEICLLCLIFCLLTVAVSYFISRKNIKEHNIFE